MEDFWEAISQTFCTEWVCIYFPMLWEIDEETQASPIWWTIAKNENLMENMHPYYGKVWVPISQVLFIWWVLLLFPVLWKIDG